MPTIDLDRTQLYHSFVARRSVSLALKATVCMHVNSPQCKPASITSLNEHLETDDEDITLFELEEQGENFDLTE
jgi:hypothetical protein